MSSNYLCFNHVLFIYLFLKDIGVFFLHNWQEPYNHTRGKILDDVIKTLRFKLFKLFLCIIFRNKYFTKRLNKFFNVIDIDNGSGVTLG